MGVIDAYAAEKLQPELLAGESLLWAGRPAMGLVFSSDDWYMVPFSLFWVTFTAFWEAGALGYWGSNSKSGASLFMGLWGIPFILIGQYLLWGRFVHDGWLKKRTYYGITQRRLLLVQEGWNRKAQFHYIDVLPTIQKEGTGRGTLWFGPKYPLFGGRKQQLRNMSRFSLGDVPVFADIDDVDSVYQTVIGIREQLTKRDSAFAR